MKLHVSFGVNALMGAHDGLDPARCAELYREALHAMLEAEWPGAQIIVESRDDRGGTRATVTECEDEARSRSVERFALDLAWVAKGCVDWRG